jgi:plastocyanin
MRRAAAGMALAVLAGCGGAASSSAPAPASARVAILGYAFHPATVTIRRGGTVTFVDRDRAKHTATARSGARFFDTGGLARGAVRRITFARAGTYAYLCSYHPFMHGTVVVR